ncbi:hypothetical protein A0257_15730 [Hymenobacter psoromatis]|nr:hypothetical protein A0257_15730 [Hymenobacter psoromatis]
MWFALVGSGFIALTLCGRAYDVANASEVRLKLDTSRPNLGGFWYEMDAGFRGVCLSRACDAWGPLASPRPAAANFELATDLRAPLLRYREPSAWKRVGLLALGALDDSMSVAELLLLAVGSWLLLKLLQDVTPATPFTLANARRLRQLALLVFGLHLWSYLAYALVWLLVPPYRVASLAAPLSHYVRLNTDDLVPSVAVGFMLLIIAAVYQRGVELSREAELVI